MMVREEKTEDHHQQDSSPEQHEVCTKCPHLGTEINQTLFFLKALGGCKIKRPSIDVFCCGNLEGSMLIKNRRTIFSSVFQPQIKISPSTFNVVSWFGRLSARCKACREDKASVHGVHAPPAQLLGRPFICLMAAVHIPHERKCCFKQSFTVSPIASAWLNSSAQLSETLWTQ